MDASRTLFYLRQGRACKKEIEDTGTEMNITINKMLAAINKLKCEYQTRTFIRN
jgi:hypothetical protein